jgi:hypothetical protein
MFRTRVKTPPPARPSKRKTGTGGSPAYIKVLLPHLSRARKLERRRGSGVGLSGLAGYRRVTGWMRQGPIRLIGSRAESWEEREGRGVSVMSEVKAMYGRPVHCRYFRLVAVSGCWIRQVVMRACIMWTLDRDKVKGDEGRASEIWLEAPRERTPISEQEE